MDDEQAKALEERVDSISAAYKEQEAKNNRLEAENKRNAAVILNVDEELRKHGGGIDLDSGVIRMANVATPEAEPTKTVVEQWEDAKERLKQMKEEGEIEDDVYLDKLSEANANIIVAKNNIAAEEQSTKMQAAETKAAKRQVIFNDFPEVNPATQDEKFVEAMSKLAKPGVDYVGNMDLYYTLCQAAKASLVKSEAAGNTGGGEGDIVDSTMAYDSMESSSGGSPGAQGGAGGVLTANDKRYTDVVLGPAATKSISKILQFNQKVGNIREGDTYFEVSDLVMES